MIKSRFGLINTLIEKHNYKSYLEIGIMYPSHCFERIHVEDRVGVDPHPAYIVEGIVQTTSDNFFEHDHRKFDIIFVDGLHQRDQVLKDVDNSLKHLNDGGTIVMHDCLPSEAAHVWDEPDWEKCGAWFGTVWEAFAILRMTRPDLEMFTLEVCAGCGIVRPGHQDLFPLHDKEQLTWDFYSQHREALMIPTNVEEWAKKEGIPW